jgi:hypothetical protein
MSAGSDYCSAKAVLVGSVQVHVLFLRTQHLNPGVRFSNSWTFEPKLVFAVKHVGGEIGQIRYLRNLNW